MLFGRLEQPLSSGDASRFLAVICGYRLRPDDLDSPFEAAMGKASDAHFGWKQITEDQLEGLAEIATEITDHELRARCADLVWLKKRNHAFGRMAAIAYIDSAEKLIASQNTLGEKERLFRGFDLAAQIDRKGPLLSDLVGRISAIVQSEELINCSLATCLDALLRSRIADGPLLHGIASRQARRIAANGPNPLWERRFWEIAARFASQAHSSNGEREAMIEIAKTFEAEADNVSLHALKAHFLEYALHQYRKISGTETDRSRVHSQLLEAQSKIRDEMIPIADESVDISQIVDASVKRMRGKDVVRGLAELVIASRWLNVDHVRQQAIDSIKSYPLQNLFSNVKFSSTWKAAAKAPGAGFDANDLSEEQLFPKMCEQYKYFIPITVSGSVEPMRNELLLAHNVMLEDVASFLRYSPFVPIGREVLFVIGIHAGLHGRFVEALHVLLPQLENLLRCLHQQDGTATSTLNQYGIQEDYDLNRLLRMAESENLLGKDLCFVLRVVFTERWGYNLRNELAHGMLSTTAFFTEVAVYAWWLIFRIVCGPAANAIIQVDEPLGATTNDHSPPKGDAN